MIIPLNIVTTYPVRWTKYKVFRDFIQNFYDSIGYLQWKEGYHYAYNDKVLSMWVRDVNFSYEWLMHIGASTKTADSFANAGYFGEGFKIASLCALRDYGWTLKMSSGNWELSVISQEQRIDGRKVSMLAYDIKERERQNCSCLEIANITEEEFAVFRSSLNGFYYPENPMMGEKLWEGKVGAVYTRSRNPYPENLPYTNDFGRHGAVFCAYQLLGSNPFDLVVCLHRYKKEDRERNSLYSFDVVSIFKEITYYIDSYGAMRVLEKMRRYWNAKPKKKIDIHSWNPVISSLVQKVSESKEMTKCFCDKYPDLLALPEIFTIKERNRRGQARAWLSEQSKKYLLVQSSFKKLGYKTLEDMCDEAGGFVVNDSANEQEQRGFEILENLIEELYVGFFEWKQTFPERKIIVNEQASYHGMAKIYKKRIPLLNNKGITIRYEIGEIYLKKSIFSRDSFYNAVSTYVHEFCHEFGGDSSNAFSLGLTDAMEILLASTKAIQSYNERWQMIFGQSLEDKNIKKA